MHINTPADGVCRPVTTNAEDYDTIDIAKQSEDNWDNEGGTFANPDEDYDLHNNVDKPSTSSRVRYLGISKVNPNSCCSQT